MEKKSPIVTFSRRTAVDSKREIQQNLNGSSTGIEIELVEERDPGNLSQSPKFETIDLPF